MKTFDELVTWATWELISNLTKGEPLRATMYRILSVVREWNPEKS